MQGHLRVAFFVVSPHPVPPGHTAHHATIRRMTRALLSLLLPLVGVIGASSAALAAAQAVQPEPTRSASTASGSPGTPAEARTLAQGVPAAQAPAALPRLRIGLVLSGGGARGLAHVGVLKALERAQVPIDAIAGTSMGAVVGGLYASGMPADTIEAEFNKVNWSRLFAQRVGRQQLSQRRKEEDFDLSTAIELGYRDGEFRAPQGAVSSRGLETLLRRYTLPVRAVQDFDQLPIPFRAVATDMETGALVILDQGDLAMALRASMSVPGLFPPSEVEGRVLGDGGLVNNLPVDVVRAMGVDVVIAVNIGTPLAGRETLNSAIGLTAQMINILTEQNVHRSLATLGKQDLLIAPDLGKLSSGDFDSAKALITLGDGATEALAEPLRALALTAEQYADWRAHRSPAAQPPSTLQFVAFEGTTATNPQRLEPQLQSHQGEAFDPQKAEADTQYLAASGDYVRADYRLVHSNERGDGLVFDLEDKPWGPNYLNIGLDLSTDFDGRSAFNVKVSHNRHWLTDNGTEWRNRLQIGEVPQVSTELYHPLKWTLGLSNDWFVAASASAERRNLSLFEDNGGEKIGEVQRSVARAGLDLGQPWGSLGELRFGLDYRAGRNQLLLRNDLADTLYTPQAWQEAGLRLRVVMDQLDFANFPQRGYRAEAEAFVGKRHDDGTRKLLRLETQATTASTWGNQTLNLHLMARGSNEDRLSPVGRYSLGGFQQLSGYQVGQLTGNVVLLGRLGWYMRLAETPVFARGFFVGASLETGNAWLDTHEMRKGGLRQGGSLYLGADTGLGPMYLGLTWAPRGEAGLVLFVGRP